MANTVRNKRGSGSDPSASDLVLGEIAVRTDTGQLFVKKDDGSVASIAGGITDGDKGDISVSNSGTTFTIDNDAVTYAKIQNVSATNRILGRDSSGAGVIEEITPASLRTMINVEDGATADQSASEIKSAYESNSDTNAFTDALLSKLNGIAASATNVTNNNQLTNGAGYITSTLTEEQVEDFVGGMVTGNTETGITVTYQDSDGTLDFVVASQTDQNFTTTLKNKLDGIESGATADQSASEIVALIADQTIAPSTIDMEDNEKIKLGAGDDLEIFHDGSNSRIKDEGTGYLIHSSDGDGVLIQSSSGQNMAKFLTGAAVELYHNYSKKLETESAGISVVGEGKFAGIVYPSANNTYNLGTTTNKWANVYATTLHGDGSNITGISAGATGGGSDEIFYENGQTVTTNYTITNGKNAMSAGPITINSGVTVTVGAGETLTIV